MVTALPGQLVATTNLSEEAERDAHSQAGAILRDLHAAGPSRHLPDMTAWLHERGMAWLEVARDIIPTHRRRRDRRTSGGATHELGPIPAVPCHLDFTPRNLLRDDHGRMRLIDFEHTRYDLAARDLVRLTTRTRIDRPDLEEAFQRTYGSLTDIDRQVIDHCRHLDDLTRTARARDSVQDRYRYPSRSVARGSSEIGTRIDRAPAPRMGTATNRREHR